MSYQYPTDPEPSNNLDAITICKNPNCGNEVPPPKKGGRPRKFCSTRCNHNFHSLAYYQRDSLKGVVIVDTTNGPQLRRRKPLTEEQAKKRLDEHHQECSANGGDYCLATRDTYGQDRICLKKSVYYEDFRELWRKERGYPFRERVATTEDGHWATGFVPPPQIAVSKLPRVPIYD